MCCVKTSVIEKEVGKRQCALNSVALNSVTEKKGYLLHYDSVTLQCFSIKLLQRRTRMKERAVTSSASCY